MNIHTKLTLLNQILPPVVKFRTTMVTNPPKCLSWRSDIIIYYFSSHKWCNRSVEKKGVFLLISYRWPVTADGRLMHHLTNPPVTEPVRGHGLTSHWYWTKYTRKAANASSHKPTSNWTSGHSGLVTAEGWAVASFYLTDDSAVIIKPCLPDDCTNGAWTTILRMWQWWNVP